MLKGFLPVAERCYTFVTQLNQWTAFHYEQYCIREMSGLINVVFYVWFALQKCVFTSALLSHLADSGQGACVVPLSIIVFPQGASGPQGAFLPSIIQNVILLAALSLKSIEIHGGLHGRVALKAPSCPAAAAAAAALQWSCGPAPLSSDRHNVSERKSTSCEGCGGPASADHNLTYLTSFSPLSTSFLRRHGPLFWKAKEVFFFYKSPSNSPFPF